MGAYSDVSIKFDPKVPNDGNWLDSSVSDSNGFGRDVMLTMCRRTANCVCLTVLELQVIGCWMSVYERTHCKAHVYTENALLKFVLGVTGNVRSLY